LKTHADPEQATMPSKSSSNSGSKSKSDGDGPVSVQTPVGSVNVDAQGNVAVQAPGVSVNASGDGKTDVSVPGTSVHTGAPNEGQKGNGNPKPFHDASNTPPVPAGPSPEEITKMEDEADQLNIRANAASGSLDTLRRQQQADGYNLRGDIAASQERMQMYLAKGNNALKAKDMVNAQKYFDLAEKEIAKVEKFLGR